MKKFVSLMLTICMLLPSLALAKSKPKEQPIPDFCKPILEAWGATNEEELQQAILTYREVNQPRDWESLHKGYRDTISIQFGGTTKELIASRKKWDLAIVSSKEVDLQTLADAEVVIRENWCNPGAFPALEQWAYPEAVQKKLPQDPLYYYYIYCYSYNAETDEAVFLVCNDRGIPWQKTWARQIIENRTPDQVRALEGLCRKIDWDNFGMPELSDTEDDLIAAPETWDWAFLRIDKEDKLERLDEAGLLYDFSQDEYWANRDPQWEWDEPSGIWNADGSQMIAIPYHEWNYNGENEISVFVVNAKSPFLARTLTYAKHYIKCNEWSEYGTYTYYSDPDEIKKYLSDFKIGYSAILKKDVDW